LLLLSIGFLKLLFCLVIAKLSVLDKQIMEYLFKPLVSSLKEDSGILLLAFIPILANFLLIVTLI